ALADFNADGRLDIVTANQGSNNVAVRLNLGNGTFGAPALFATNGPGPRTVAVADVNGDGKLDLAVPNVGGPSVSVLPGNGYGTFGAPLVFSTGDLPTGANPNDATLADLNGDGLPDLSTANAGTGGFGSVSVRLNTTPTIALELQDASGNVVAAGPGGTSNY